MNGRISYLATKYAARLDAAMAGHGPFPAAAGEAHEDRIRALAPGDPSGRGRHLEALVRWHCRGQLGVDQLEVVRDALSLLDRGKSRLAASERNPLAMPDPSALAAVAERLRAEEQARGAVSGKAADRALSARMRHPPHARVLHDGADGLLVEVYTAAAAAWWGRGTKWCTSGQDGVHARAYLRKGPLYVACLPEGAKFQWSCAAPVADTRNNDAGFEEVLARIPAAAEHAIPLAALLRRAPALAAVFLAGHPDEHRARAAAFGPDAVLDAGGRLDRDALAAGLAAHPDALRRIPAEMLDRGLCRIAVERLPGAFQWVPRPLADSGMARVWMQAYGCDAAKLHDFVLDPATPWAAACTIDHCRPTDLIDLLDDPEVAAHIAAEPDLAARAVVREPAAWWRLPAAARLHPEVVAAAAAADLTILRAVFDTLPALAPAQAEAVRAALAAAAGALLSDSPLRLTDLPTPLLAHIEPSLLRRATAAQPAAAPNRPNPGADAAPGPHPPIAPFQAGRRRRGGQDESTPASGAGRRWGGALADRLVRLEASLDGETGGGETERQEERERTEALLVELAPARRDPPAAHPLDPPPAEGEGGLVELALWGGLGLFGVLLFFVAAFVS